MSSDIKKYLAVDLGASSGRVMVGYLDGTYVSLTEAHRFPTPSFESNGHFHWHLDELQAHILDGIDRGLRLAPDARSISVDSWAVDYVSIDAKGRVIGSPFCYRDSRTEGMMDLAFRSITRDRLYEITGIQYLPFNTLFQILADKQDQYQSSRPVANRLLIADYFNHVLGGRPVIDLSMASTTHMIDARSQEWSDEILDTFAIDRATLPDIVPSGTVVGKAEGYPGVRIVATCSHDTGAAVAAVPATYEDETWAYVSSGTWSLVGLELDEPLLSVDAMDAGFTNEIGLDGCIRFLKNVSGLWTLQECMREWRAKDPGLGWRTLIQEATTSDVGEQRIDIDDPRFMAHGDMLGRLAGYCREKDIPFPRQRGAVARLLLESLADAYARVVLRLEEVARRKISVIHIVGGGSQNELLCQLSANATGCRVEAGPVEATALGNVLVQARTLGDLPEDASVRDVVRRSFTVKTFNPL